MKKKDEDAFLKSIFGASPIKKKGGVEKKIPQNNIKNFKQNPVKTIIKTKQKQLDKKEHKKSFFVLEKSKTNKKLKKGKIPIDRKVDFHGLSVLDAETLFKDTVISCYNKNLRCILFITGKGVMKKNNNYEEVSRLYYGKIRAGFLSWIKEASLQKYILSVEQASIDFGADGAFFVYLRKNN